MLLADGGVKIMDFGIACRNKDRRYKPQDLIVHVSITILIGGHGMSW